MCFKLRGFFGLVGLLFVTSFAQSLAESAEDSMVGTWELDTDAFRTVIEAELGEIADPFERAMAREFALEFAENMSVTMSLYRDGAGVVEMEAFGERDVSTGTWSLDGDTFTYVEVDDQGREDAITGWLEGDLLMLEVDDEGMLFTFVYRKTSSEPLPREEVSGKAASPETAAREGDPVTPRVDRDCPPEIAAEPRPAGAPVDDVVGLRVGMSLDDIQALLTCRGDVPRMEIQDLWNVRQNFGIETRQLLRASDGVVCSQSDLRRVECDSGGRFTPVRDLSQEFVVVFTGMPGQEQAQAIWRRSRFAEDAYPTVAALVDALSQKYGEPHIHRTEVDMMYNTSPRPGAVNLTWVYNHQGQPIPPSEAVGFNRDCVNGPKPYFATRQSWNSGCGLTIRAEILPVEGSTLVARGLDVMVMDQRRLFHSSQRFEAELAEAYEARLQEGAAGAPDL